MGGGALNNAAAFIGRASCVGCWAGQIAACCADLRGCALCCVGAAPATCLEQRRGHSGMGCWRSHHRCMPLPLSRHDYLTNALVAPVSAVQVCCHTLQANWRSLCIRITHSLSLCVHALHLLLDEILNWCSNDWYVGEAEHHAVM